MKLTAREEEIIKILQQQPMISQEELANMLNISRSATAVHISNLIKKGKIVGRGYVLSQPKNIILLGQIIAKVTVDTLQNISYNTNGLGYSLSRGLAKIGEKITLISAVGDDLLGKAILTELDHSNIDKKHLTIKPESSTAIELTSQDNYLKNNGALESITEELLYSKEHLFNNAILAINDCSFGVNSCLTLLNLCNKHNLKSLNILIDVKEINQFFSTDVLIKMDNIVMLKHQLLQLGISQIDFEELINNNTFPLHAKGNQIILCEEEGVLIISKTDIKHVALLPGQKLNEQFMVGFIYGLVNGYNYSQAARIGLGNFHQLLKEA